MGKKVFERGDKVEVCSKEQGFIGSYYEATIVEHVLEASDHILRHKYRVKYTHLVKEHDQSEPLEEIVKADDVRPPPPPPPPPRAYSPKTLRLVTVESKPKFMKGDRVDAFDNDGWWVGTVLGKKGEDYIVHFGNYGDKNAYPSTKLRRHLEYRNGNWHHPKKLRPIQVWRQCVL